jgi:glyoxylase-like metal-dependent hydrolase (beta-lactamase superfamily II)
VSVLPYGLEIVTLPNGQFAENCYLVADTRTREAVIVDPGEEPAMFLAELDTRAWSLKGIWLTHAHIDHVLGIPAVRARHDVPILLHPEDRPLYENADRQAEWFGIRLEPLPDPDHSLTHGETVAVGGFDFDVRHTPGHSPGSVSFVGQGVVLSGDALFAGSIGRTDLPGGDLATLLLSIQRQLLTLPDSTEVLSGHGPRTTVGVERLTNPFLTADIEVD